MKTIEVDEQIYNYIASQTQHIGESASDILRRLLLGSDSIAQSATVPSSCQSDVEPVSSPVNKEVIPEPVAVVTVKAKKATRRSELDSASVPEMSLPQLLESEQFTSLERAISRFMMILAALYREQPEQFVLACDIKGKKRSYFSKDRELLVQAGRTTKPRSIPGSPFWVITNVNAERKKLILKQLMDGMGCSSEITEAACLKL